MKKHNTFKVVLITMLVFVLLTWILPAAYFQSEYVEQGRVQMGLFDLFNYPLTSISYFGYIALFVIAVGGFYGILYKIPAYRTFLDKIVSKFVGKEIIVLSIIMVLVAVFASITGVQLALVALFPLLVSIILLMGYDKIVAALALVGSTMIGIAGTTFGYANTNIITSVLSVDITAQMVIKVVILVAGLALLILNTILYIKKALGTTKNSIKAEKTIVKSVEVAEEVKPEEKKTTVKKTAVKKAPAKKTTSKTSKTTKTTKSKSTTKASRKDNKAANKDEDVIVVKKQLDENVNGGFVPTVVDSNHKIWPFVLSFIIIFVLMILAFTPWANSFKMTAFTDATTSVSEFEIFGFALFGKLLGTVNAFGAWTITDLFFVFGVIVLVLALIYKVKFDDIVDGFISGAKKALAPAVIVILLYTILVIVTYHPFQLVIYKAILGLTSGFNVFTSSIVAILASIFNVDPSYTFQSVLPYFASVVTNSKSYEIAAVLYQAIYGVTMLIAPTSLILMGLLSYLGVSYGKWVKTIWKLVVELLVVVLVLLTILV